MADQQGVIDWYLPKVRCVIEPGQFKVPKRLARTVKTFELAVDTNWNEVIRECANREHTWISNEIIDVYTKLHHAGFAHSIEAYREGRLVGGLYGVALGGAFMGESMFHRERDASKVCLAFLVERLAMRGFILLDCQFATRHLISLGAILITCDEYLARLDFALQLRPNFG